MCLVNEDRNEKKITQIKIPAAVYIKFTYYLIFIYKNWFKRQYKKPTIKYGGIFQPTNRFN